MNKCYLCLGSNQSNPDRQIRRAIKSIQSLPSTAVTKISNLHWTKAWGMHRQQDFCNAMLEITTTLTPLLLLKLCQKIEHAQGRVRHKRWGPRTLDIDIIFYGNRVVHTKDLIIPHPLWSSRDFVRIPLLELSN